MLHQQTLAPGVRLTALQSHKFKTGILCVNFLRPLSAGEAAMNALLPSLLLRGSRRLPDIRSISRALDELYGAAVGTLVRKKGEVQAVGLYADFIEDDFVGEPVFDRISTLLGQFLLEPLTRDGAFLQDYYLGERENLHNAMAAELNDKRIYALRRMLAHMCPDEPYGVPAVGLWEHIADVSHVGLTAHYHTLLSTSPVEVFYMGQRSPAQVADRLHRMLENLPRQPLVLLPKVEARHAAELRTYRQTMDLSQSKLCVGCRMPPSGSAKELAERLVFNVIYGAGSNSKLFLHMREERSLCYYASAAYDKYKGLLLINSGIDRSQLSSAREEIFHQLAQCVNGAFTDTDLELAKLQIISQLRADLDSPSRLEEYYLGQAVLRQSQTIDELICAVETVDAPAVCRAAASVEPDTLFFLEGIN